MAQQTAITETDLKHLFGDPHRGKVRDTYDLPDEEHLFMIATDRTSAFDVVLPTGVPGKGKILNDLSAFWFRATQPIIPNHLRTQANMPPVLEILEMSIVDQIPDEVLQRGMIVRKAERIDIECVVRGYITGSAWAEYQRQGTVSGKSMPSGMVEGSPFPGGPVFTPTTKAEVGHDQNMSDQQVVDMVGEELARQLERFSIEVYNFGHDYARRGGIILADTKMEFGLVDGELTLIDELLTPDSSRFWDLAGYQPGQSQPNFDKQFVRDWLVEQGWNQEPPAPELPPDVVEATIDRYHEAYRRITTLGRG